jgi:Phosphodiester glycosidase
MLKPSLTLLLFVTACDRVNPQVEPPRPELHYHTVVYPQAKLHVVTVPAGAGTVAVAVSDRLQTVSAFDDPRFDNSFAILNAGFFDPNNQKSTSYATIDGKVVADPRENEGLTQNPKLKPYLPAIFDRSEFRRYDCKGTVRYGIARHSAPIPSTCKLVDAIGGGPQLLPNLTAQEEAFFDPTTGRDPIGVAQNNARSAIGLTATGDVLLVMAESPNGGVSLLQLASWMGKLGAIQALNLDGGSSSSLYYDQQIIMGKTTDQKAPVARLIKSVLRVRKPL